MKRGVIGLSLETLVIIVLALIILVLAVSFIGDFFLRQLGFINGTVPS